MVVGAAQRHGRGDGWGVGEGGRVVHARVGESALCEGREAWELTLELTGKWAQVGGAWKHKKTQRHILFDFVSSAEQK